MKIKFMTYVLPVMLFLLSGCGKESGVQALPIDEGIDVCDVCHMEVADDPFATQVILTNDRAYKFDDIGCMYEWLKDQDPAGIKAKFVRDYKTSEWILLEKASFAFDPSYPSPMGYGVYSFQDPKLAKEWVEGQGKGQLLSPQDLDQHEWTRHDDFMKDLKEQLMKEQSSKN